MLDKPFKLASQWQDFLSEIDQLLAAPTQITCIGGFVLTEIHGASRNTGDLDLIKSSSETIEELQNIAGKGSALHKKHKLYVEYVGIVTMPLEYESRLIPLQLPLEKLMIFIPEVYDLILSKLERNSPKDQADIEFLARRYDLSYETLRKRFDDELDFIANHEYHLATLEKFWRDWFQE
jgi:hypothetical protein